MSLTSAAFPAAASRRPSASTSFLSKTPPSGPQPPFLPCNAHSLHQSPQQETSSLLRNLLSSVPPQPLVLQTISSCFHPQTAHSQPSLLQASRVLSTRVNPPEAAWRSRQEPPTRTGWLLQAGEGKPSATDGPKGQEDPHTPSKSNDRQRERNFAA